MYYYSSKENLMLGMVEHAAARWDGLLRDHTGAAPEALSVFERYRAYAAVATYPTTPTGTHAGLSTAPRKDMVPATSAKIALVSNHHFFIGDLLAPRRDRSVRGRRRP